ncbi:hypothetical protein OF83DRAFT_1194430 [Amylostereum chailletii]|nr:hypothetical protein OF83DRAFT_1194430 [Amylostereum chailletii]
MPVSSPNLKHFPFKVVDKSGKPIISITCRGKEKGSSPEEISSVVLIKMEETAESHLVTTIDNTVVTSPCTPATSNARPQRMPARSMVPYHQRFYSSGHGVGSRQEGRGCAQRAHLQIWRRNFRCFPPDDRGHLRGQGCR